MPVSSEQIEAAAQAIHELADERSQPAFRVAWQDCLPAYRKMLLSDAKAALEAAALLQGALEPAFIEAMAAEYTRLAWSSAPLSTWPAADRELIIDRFMQSYLAALAATPPSSQGAPEWRALLTEARNEIDHYADTAREHDLVARIDTALAAPPSEGG